MYNVICVADSRCEFISKRFTNTLYYIDPDLPIYYQNWINHLARIIRNFYELDDLWNLNGGKFHLTSDQWINMNLYEREAHKMVASSKIEESNKEAKKQKMEMEQKMEAAKEYRSQFSGITMPRFVN